MRASTRIMLEKHGWRVDRFVHNYLYFLFYYPYVKISYWVVRSIKYLAWFKPLTPVGKMVFDRYHAKVLSHGDTRKIFALNENLQHIGEENKKIIPFKYATDIIFQEPEFIVVMDCPCKLSTGAAQEDINSCIAVGRGIGSFWLEHCGKYHPRKISQAESLGIIEKCRKRGHINQAFMKVATGGSTGVICNCHPDTCVSLQATRFSAALDKNLTMTAKSGYSVARDEKKCIACGTCGRVCSFGAMTNIGGQYSYDREKCIGCELCVENCAQEALSLYIDPEKPLPLDLDRIKERIHQAADA